MTFEAFIDLLQDAGWVARNDAQWENINALWDKVCDSEELIKFSD